MSLDLILEIIKQLLEGVTFLIYVSILVMFVYSTIFAFYSKDTMEDAYKYRDI